jgi:hypothetical protein
VTDDLREHYVFPDAFGLSDARHMDRVEAADGTPFRVLVSPGGTRRALVHEDVAVYDGYYDHPVTTGVIGFLLVGGVFAGLLGATYELTATVPSAPATVGVALGGIAGAWVLANLLLYRTLVGDWLFRFLEWNDHRELLLVDRGGPA